jgi:hypothetical protein
MTDKTYETPWEDLQKSALEHYEDISSKAHHWNSFVPAAIRAYQKPDTPTKEEKFLAFLNDRLTNGSVFAFGGFSVAKQEFLKIFNITEDVKDQ